MCGMKPIRARLLVCVDLVTVERTVQDIFVPHSIYMFSGKVICNVCPFLGSKQLA